MDVDLPENNPEHEHERHLAQMPPVVDSNNNARTGYMLAPRESASTLADSGIHPESSNKIGSTYLTPALATRPSS